MLLEIIATASIIAACGAGTWFAKNKFQPQIERGMMKKEAPETARHRRY